MWSHKNSIPLLLIVCFALLVVGCSDDDDDNGGTNPPTPTGIEGDVFLAPGSPQNPTNARVAVYLTLEDFWTNTEFAETSLARVNDTTWHYELELNFEGPAESFYLDIWKDSDGVPGWSENDMWFYYADTNGDPATIAVAQDQMTEVPSLTISKSADAAKKLPNR